MPKNHIIDPGIIDLQVSAGSKAEALDQLTGLLYRTERISDRSAFLEAILEREAIETTDLGIGVAIPHGHCSAVLKPSVAVAKFAVPFDWDADPEPQDPPTFACFLMASSPADTDISHIDIIAKIATLLINEEFVEFLRSEITTPELIEKIHSLIGEI